MALSSASSVGPERAVSSPLEQRKADATPKADEGLASQNSSAAALKSHPASMDGSRYRAQMMSDVSQVQSFQGGKTREKSPASPSKPLEPAKLPATLDVTMEWKRSVEPIRVKTERLGSFEGGTSAYSLKFTTKALGIQSLVTCSIVICLDPRLTNPKEAVEKAVRLHCRAIAIGGTQGLKSMGNYYVAKPGKKAGESETSSGYPTGRYTADPNASKPKLGNTRADGSVVENSPSDVEILLSEGKTIRTTANRLKNARILAEAITFMIGEDGKRRKASPKFVEGAVQRLAAFSVADMNRLLDNGYTICFVDRSKKPKGGYPGGSEAPKGKDGNWKDGVGGYAAYGDKVLVIPCDGIGQVGGGDSDVLLHEIAHSISDCRVSDTLFGTITRSLDNDSAIVELFEAYAKRCGYDTGKGRSGKVSKPEAVWSHYACQGSHEYLAEGITFLKQGGASREALKSKDPKFYQKLLKLFPEDAAL